MTLSRAARSVHGGLLLVVLLLSLPALAEDEPYNILVTNDDGVGAPGVRVLAEALAGVGTVHVLAPCEQQSGASMSVALRDELHVKDVPHDGKATVRCVDTTPANTVILAVTALAPEGGYDLVVSGINHGANVGTASHMSGTVGGAMAGAFYDIPALAVSLGDRRGSMDYPARFVVSFVSELKKHPPMPGIVFSINIPRAAEEEIAGVTIAEMGGIHLEFDYDETESGEGTRTFRPRISRATRAPESSDTEAYLNNRITIAPLQFDWTAHTVMEQLEGWGLTHELAGEQGP